MSTVKHPHRKGLYGFTVGQRKDGSRAVLWADDTITWHSFDEYANMLKAA